MLSVKEVSLSVAAERSDVDFVNGLRVAAAFFYWVTHVVAVVIIDT